MALVVKNREEWRQFWLDNYQNRNPDADVGPNSLPWARGSVMADMLSIQSNNALVISGGIPLDSLVGDQLDLKYGTRLPRILSTKSSGYITLECGTSGTEIRNLDQLVCGATSNKYQFTGVTDTYLNSEQLSIQSVDPGLGQNLDPGTVLQWSSQRAGCYATVTVWEQTDGSGIAGGRERESDEEYRGRIRSYLANPVGHGNEGDLLVLLEESSPNDALGRPGHGMPVQKGFVYPAVQGPGTFGCAIVMKAENNFETRAPSSAQLTAVLNYVAQYMPDVDMIFMAAITNQVNNVYLSVTLDTRAAQWSDAAPWPPYVAPGSGQYIVTGYTDATTFQLGVDNATYGGTTAPAVSNTIALWDRAHGAFRRKKILTVVGAGPWAITVDTTGGQSDVSYTPEVYQVVSPWFDAINEVAAAEAATIAKLGPGQMNAWDPGDGKRMMRIPLPSPTEWPLGVTARIAFDVTKSVPAVADATLLYTENSAPTVGDTSHVHLLYLADLGIYKT